jgi:uncharacterized protein
LRGDEEKGPNRTCVATREVLPIERLIRFVPDPGGRLTPDIRAKLPGRGAWVRGTRAALEEAIRRKAFARSLKRPVLVPDDLADQVETLLRDDARQSLAMANKAGLVVTGFGKVETAVSRGHVEALIIAADGGDDGRRKILQAVKRTHGDAKAIPVVATFLSSELDLALGRENVIHAALLAGSAGDAFVRRRRRLEIFQGGAVDDAADDRGPDAVADAASTGPLPLEHEAGSDGG